MAYFNASHIVIIVFVLSWNKGVTIDLLCQRQRKVRRLLSISKPKQRFIFFGKKKPPNGENLPQKPH
jgi:hypothetical protein